MDFSINDLYNYVNFLANKNQSGNITPAQFNLAVQRCQQEFINKEFRLWQTTREVTDALAPLLVYTIISPDTSGEAAYPDDYMHVSSIRALWFRNGKGVPVEIREITDDDAGDLLMSPIVQPTTKYPAMTYYADYMQFYPKEINTIQFTYFRYPPVPVWAYTMVNNRPVYDSSNSIQLEVRSEYQNEIAEMICSQFGIFLRDQSLIQYAETLKAQQP